MSAQPGRPDLHHSKTVLAGPLLRERSLSYIRLNSSIPTRKTKKAAPRLVQSEFNTFIINRNLRKSRRENAKKTSKIDPFQAFSSFFGASRSFAGLQPRRLDQVSCRTKPRPPNFDQ
jgi:hypothetical protein